LSEYTKVCGPEYDANCDEEENENTPKQYAGTPPQNGARQIVVLSRSAHAPPTPHSPLSPHSNTPVVMGQTVHSKGKGGWPLAVILSKQCTRSGPHKEPHTTCKTAHN
jgi:hypothetical protein